MEPVQSIHGEQDEYLVCGGNCKEDLFVSLKDAPG